MQIEPTEFPSEIMWLDHHHDLSLHELAQLSGLSTQELNRLIDNGALKPNNENLNTAKSTQYFSSHCLISIRTLSRLKQDFELEPNALSLTLIFLERIRTLEFQLRDLNK